MSILPDLTVEILCTEAAVFAKAQSNQSEPLLYGITDGKAVGTYLEHKFRGYLAAKYNFSLGNSAIGIDFPNLNIDMKVTSIRQPQSSCPFKSARQKIYGLGYSLILFVYEKIDDNEQRHATLKILHTVLIEAERTADFQTTKGIYEILKNNGNRDDLIAFMFDRNLPIDEIGAGAIADEILQNPPQQGFLTISNALQWRLQYTRVIERAGQEDGILSLSSVTI